jgi:two-component sensor histidine kinase
LHELATNAAKYGALSAPGGTVAIAWTIAAGGDGGSLRFRWQERGGPPPAPSERKGFGTALLKATLGAGTMLYAPEGLIYEIDLPLAQIEGGAKSAGA